MYKILEYECNCHQHKNILVEYLNDGWKIIRADTANISSKTNKINNKYTIIVYILFKEPSIKEENIIHRTKGGMYE